MHWKEIRIKFLILIFGTGILIIGKLFLFPNLNKPKINVSVFPEKVPLNEWQFIVTSHNNLPTTNEDNQYQLLEQKHYRYVKNNLPLDIKIHYLENLYYADISAYIKKNLDIQSSSVMRHQKGIGYYGLGIDKQKAYLSTCINSRGGSTFTHEQFRHNRFSQDIQLERIIPILLGKEMLLDKRCLWVHLSIPIRNSSPEEAYQILEKAWFSWYRWWQPRFPKP
ncbi:cyanoexosortase A system-associated protein [Anabaena sp. FACHB-709]|uniref:Cyanoexosortase A system-associated protein n=2 Tax=Nostocaceae TaxID=1162 RepID=A0A1Z4KPG3_ANAVA|nr:MULTISPECIES: cyanoexosortase A system-associated protein [Nostocaceae]BAY70844.1 hypothetical protein NIES23_36530 [Trichormus variabilis NIES-23]MBD2171248.1 cyanoexosortase A system-associated protein [Anabaena cylindrica FACHB-318]MBD2263082.1 cyanoexosortase A system-associated protein [Anabaena sp. FACHB-709]MBD2272575.1 cyanoexosortase A system-associated protein [Nostoc sp. PCC 7120 = FACHB-418]MBD2283681.1 cyanoexosortase A system-associated protein [Anabaena cylindrica FACHB-170]